MKLNLTSNLSPSPVRGFLLSCCL